MGDKNVIALLTSINGNLKKIVETSQTNGNQSKEEVSEKMAQSLNTGTVLNGDAVKPKAEQGKIGDIVISASNQGILVSDKERSAHIKPFVEEIDTDTRL